MSSVLMLRSPLKLSSLESLSSTATWSRSSILAAFLLKSLRRSSILFDFLMVAGNLVELLLQLDDGSISSEELDSLTSGSRSDRSYFLVSSANSMRSSLLCCHLTLVPAKVAIAMLFYLKCGLFILMCLVSNDE